jgi:hypothetical protein
VGGGGELRSFEGAAAQPSHVGAMLKGLDQMAGSAKLRPQSRRAAADLAAELRKASARGLKRVTIAEPAAEAHEHLHFAVERLKFDPDKILAHPETRVAVTRAMLRGLRFERARDSRGDHADREPGARHREAG